MIPTKLTYLDDSNKTEDTAVCIDVVQTEEGKTAVILDKTIFYPQGGGQPYDTGFIRKNEVTFDVVEVRWKDGSVYHIGSFSQGIFKTGEVLHLQVDTSRRNFNRRNHTAGHLIDIAVKNLHLSFTPVKGYHFPEGAYVEYAGAIHETERDEIKQKIEAEANRLIDSSNPVTASLVAYEELFKLCDFVPDYIPRDKPIRIVKVGVNKAHPCGGIHVNNTSEVKAITVDKIKNKGGNTRISYSIAHEIK